MYPTDGGSDGGDGGGNECREVYSGDGTFYSIVSARQMRRPFVRRFVSAVTSVVSKAARFTRKAAAAATSPVADIDCVAVDIDSEGNRCDSEASDGDDGADDDGADDDGADEAYVDELPPEIVAEVLTFVRRSSFGDAGVNPHLLKLSFQAHQNQYIRC
jgi:hypothetical protein